MSRVCPVAVETGQEDLAPLCIDLDGTLVNSIPDLADATNAMCMIVSHMSWLLV